MMVKEKKNDCVSIFRNKCEMLITPKGSHFETSDKVFFKYHVLPLANMIIIFFFFR